MKRHHAWQIYLSFSIVLIGLSIAGCGGKGGTTGHWNPPVTPVIVAPTVTAVVPIDAASDIAINTKIITAAFSKAMDPATLTTTSFTLACPAGSPVTNTAVTYLEAGNVATLTLPAAPDLPAGTVCTATITTDAKDLAGNALASDFVWQFTTGLVADTARPSVLLTIPETTAPGPTAGVATNMSITAVFNEDMAPATIAGTGLTTFTVAGPGATPVAGDVIYTVSSRTALFTPSPALLPSTTYTVTITAVATDLAGNALGGNQAVLPASSNYIWTFTTGTGADSTRPTVTAETPDSPPDVAINTKIITAAFSEPMKSSTLTTASFNLECPAGTPVTETVVSYQEADSVASITLPAATNLPNSTVCTATVTTAATDLAGNALASDYVWTFTTSAAADTSRPTVTADAPNSPPNVAVNTKTLTASFSEAMNSGTLTPSSFKVECPAGSLVTGTGVTYLTAGSMATLTLPASPDLPANTICTATVTTDAEDSAGNALSGNQGVPGAASNYVWTFTTGNVADATRPTVTATAPVMGDTEVPTNRKTITATFSETMNSGSLTLASFTLSCNGSPVTGTGVAYLSTTNVATLSLPSATNLPADTLCTATVTTTAKDLAGNLLEGNQGAPGTASNHVWTFTTGAPPVITAVTPLDNSIGVCVNWTFSATFNEAMTSNTITPAGNFTVQTGTSAPLGPALGGTTSYDAVTRIATFNPTADLLPDTLYTATVKGGSSGAKDASGDAMASDKVWTFRTGTAICQSKVVLGRSSNFAILASAAITNIPTSNITGDLGLTPDTGANITGFSSPLTCPEVTGTIYKVDAAGPACATNSPTTISDAKTDAGIAFTDARNAVRGTPVSISGNLNGLTLYPGLYESLSSIEISAGGHLYLDALGDTNAVFILRSATSITTEATSEVHLTNGAKADNVYWTAGSAVTLGTSSKMKGTIIAGTAITLLNLANLEGRALNQGPAAAEIKCNTCTIVVPSP